MMSLDLLSFELMASALAVAVGAWVQGSVGFGSALVAAPVLALLAPQLVPGPLIFSSLGLSFAAAMREHGSIDRRGVLLSSLGRLPGVVLGGAALAWAGHFGQKQLVEGLVLMPAMVLGFALSGSSRSYLDQGRTRAAVLAVAALSAAAVLLKPLVGK